jgi:hypothetical protein
VRNFARTRIARRGISCHGERPAHPIAAERPRGSLQYRPGGIAQCISPIACQRSERGTAFYKPNQFRRLVRHDGRTSGSEVLHSIPRDLRQQAERIGARLKFRSRLTGGTEIDLRVPAEVAFESHSSHRGFGRLDRLYKHWEQPAEPDRMTGTG